MDHLLSTPVHSSLPLLWIDAIALVWFLTCWIGYTYFTDHRKGGAMNLHDIMDTMRGRWMSQMLTRDIRIMDAGLIGNLLRSISFFASTSIFIMIGLITLLGYRKQAMEIVAHIPFAEVSTPAMWEAKILLLAIIFIYAFFKYTWSLRQYNYACILVGAAPSPEENKEMHDNFAQHAGDLIANAGRHFNMGLRAYYFGLAAIAWFVHPLFFMAVSALVVVVVYRREFQSRSAITLRQLHEKCYLPEER